MSFRPLPYRVPALDRKTGLPSLADLDRKNGVLVVAGALALTGDLARLLEKSEECWRAAVRPE
jgi:hypothetical protein